MERKILLTFYHILGIPGFFLNYDEKQKERVSMKIISRIIESQFLLSARMSFLSSILLPCVRTGYSVWITYVCIWTAYSVWTKWPLILVFGRNIASESLVQTRYSVWILYNGILLPEANWVIAYNYTRKLQKVTSQ